MNYQGHLSITCGSQTIVIDYTTRDWHLLIDVTEAQAATRDLPRLLGLGSEPAVKANRLDLLRLAKVTLARLSAESELLEFDYLVDLPAHGVLPQIAGSCHVHGIRFEGQPCTLYARHGQCWIEKWDDKGEGIATPGERLDLRRLSTLELDGGVLLKIRRKKQREPPWVSGLTAVASLLETCRSKSVVVRNPLR